MNNLKYQEQYLEALKKDCNNFMYIPTHEVTVEILQEIVSGIENFIIPVPLQESYLVKLYCILANNVDLIQQYERDEELNKQYNSNIPINKDNEDMVFTLYELIGILSDYLDDLLKINVSNGNYITALSFIIDCRIRECDKFIRAYKLIDKIKKSNFNNSYNLHNSIKRLSGEKYSKYLFFINSFNNDIKSDFTDYRNYFVNCSFDEYIKEFKEYKQQLDEYIEEKDNELY